MTNHTSNDEKRYPKPLEEAFERVLTPFQEFINDERTGSVLLLVCTLSALLLANSPLAHDYEALVEMPVGFVFGELSLTMSVRHWINDGLLSLFFFVLGLEIKREILVGELKDLQQALPVIAGALGGMLIPTAIFFMFNLDSKTVHGWGIPMATDTAFAVGVLALLGRRIPVALFAFLTALAIVDDLGAILVLAVFYTDSLSPPYLGLAGLSLLFLVGCNAFGCRRPGVYFLGGAMVWLAMLGSGVHATIAGVLVAMTIPARPKREHRWFVRRARVLIDEFEKVETQSEKPILGSDNQHTLVERVHDTAEKATTPLRRWERFLERPIALFVMPVFALTNAGIAVEIQTLSALTADRLATGIVLGLVVGKSVGITLLTWVALRLNLGRLPRNATIRHIAGIGLLGGMGFTISIFIAGLGFANNLEALITAKTAILLASMLSGISGYLWLRLRV